MRTGTPARSSSVAISKRACPSRMTWSGVTSTAERMPLVAMSRRKAARAWSLMAGRRALKGCGVRALVRRSVGGEGTMAIAADGSGEVFPAAAARRPPGRGSLGVVMPGTVSARGPLEVWTSVKRFTCPRHSAPRGRRRPPPAGASRCPTWHAGYAPGGRRTPRDHQRQRLELGRALPQAPGSALPP